MLGLASIPLAGPIGTGITTFTDLLISKKFKKKDKSVWAQIKDKLEYKINERITEYHFDSLRTKFDKLEGYLKPGSTINKHYLNTDILHMMKAFLPNHQTDMTFHTKFMTAFPAYLTYVGIIYNELIRKGEFKKRNGKIDKCILARELKNIRKETINAAKALSRSRYRNIIGNDAWKGSPKKCTGGYGCWKQQWLQFKDQTTGISNGYLISDVNWKFLDPLERNTTDWIWDGLVSKVNLFFDNSNVYCSRKYPKPIEKKR